MTDSPAGKVGTVLAVAFTLASRRFLALNGRTRFEYPPPISFVVDCADEAEVGRVWNVLSDGGRPSVLPRLLGDRDRAKAHRVMRARLQMRKLDITAPEVACAGRLRDLTTTGESP